MSRNGSGVYSLPAGNPVVTGTTISSSWANTTLSDIATALTGSVASDGQTPMTGNLQMGSNKITGLAVATSTGDALSYGQAATVTDLAVTGNATVGGTLTLTGGLTLNGNVTVGDSSADTLTVNATSTFAAGATFSSTFAANGGVTLGDASGDALTINSSAVSIPNGLNFDSNTLVIDATNNRVGVGTASPSESLQIRGSADTFAFIDSTGATNKAGISVGNGGSTYGQLYFDNTNNNVSLLQKYSSGSLVLGTNSTERMRIDSSGNVGIGTSSPSQPVELVKNQNASTWFSASNNNSGTGAASGYLMTNNTGVLGALQLNSSTNTTSGAGDAVVLRTLSTNPLVFGTNSTERMRIDSSGNVGIGTSSPNSPLSFASSTGQKIRFYNTLSGYGIGVESSEFRFVTDNGAIFTWGTGTYASPTERMRIDSSGNLLVGATSQFGSAQVCASASTASYAIAAWNNATSGNNTLVNFGTEASFTSRGSITYNRAGGLIAYNTTSDYRAKTVKCSVQNALEKVSLLKPCTGRMNDAEQDIDFFVAHELQEIVPSAVTGVKDELNEDGTPKYQMVDKSALIPLLTAAIQELKAEVDSLKAQLNK